MTAYGNEISLVYMVYYSALILSCRACVLAILTFYLSFCIHSLERDQTAHRPITYTDIETLSLKHQLNTMLELNQKVLNQMIQSVQAFQNFLQTIEQTCTHHQELLTDPV